MVWQNDIIFASAATDSLRGFGFGPVSNYRLKSKIYYGMAGTTPVEPVF